MPKEPLGITFIIPAGQEATGVYEVEGGIEVFETDTPYLLSDGVSLQPPLPVFDAGGPVFADSMGNVQKSLGVSGLGPVDAPENTVAPVVSGTAQVGETLTTTNGTWTGNPSPTYSYQWQRNTGTWGNITGATASTYELVEADETFTIRCVVTATNSEGSASANSNATDAVAAAPDVTAPTLSNPTGDLSVDTDEGNGTLYWYVSTSATPPSALDLKAGTGADDYGSQAVIATGEQTASTSGLTTEVTYYAHFLHRDGAGNESAIATSAGFVVETVALSGHLAMGDSWTWETGGYADLWAAAHPSIAFNKIAAPGWKVADLQARVADAAALAPRSISVLIGLNNLQTMTAETFLTDAQAFVASLKAAIPGVSVFVGTIPPSGSHPNVNPRRAIANPAIRAGSGVWHDGVIPIGDYLADADAGDGVANTDYYNNGSAPGHPRGNLGNIMATILGAVLDPFHADAVATSPDAFAFSDIPGAPADQSFTVFTSAPLTGMAAGHAATAVLTGAGAFRLGRGGVSDANAKTVYNGDWPAITATSSATVSPPTAVNSTLTIGATADTFTTTTGPLASDDFDRANGAPGTTPVGGLAWFGPAQIAGNKLVLGQAVSGYGAIDPGVLDVDYTVDVTVPGSGLGNVRLMMLGKQVAVHTDWRNAFGRFYILELAEGRLALRHETVGTISLGTFTGLTAGTYTIRVVAKTSDRTINVYNGETLLVSGTYSNDGNWLPQGTCIGVLDNFQNANIAIDNLSVAAA